jgi:hypothetical protein
MRKTANTTSMPIHFSGHETFPMRQMWLKKVFERADYPDHIEKTVFTNQEAIAEFGVGKNMVASIKHWALACNIITEDNAKPGTFAFTDFAQKVLPDEGLDPYAENPTTAWYAHWWLAGNGHRSTTWKWLFNHVTAPTFSKADLEKPLADFACGVDPKRKLSSATISRDIDTCIRGYAPRSVSGSPEDYAEPMLGELGLIFEERKGFFSFRRGPKPTLHNGMFTYALLDFWRREFPGQSSLAFEKIAYAEGSPGRVFKLDEDSVAERLLVLEDLTRKDIAWTDTAGLRQVHRKTEISDKLLMRMIEKAYV